MLISCDAGRTAIPVGSIPAPPPPMWTSKSIEWIFVFYFCFKGGGTFKIFAIWSLNNESKEECKTNQHMKRDSDLSCPKYTVFVYKEPTRCSLAVCLLVTAILLYMFRTLSASILRST
jgi:hypothetical protein